MPDPEQQAVEDDLVAQVLRSFDGCEDARLRELLQSLAGHLHAFVRDVRLTEEEWRVAIDFLTRTGAITDERRQEFVLLSDVLGVSMQTIAVANPGYAGATEATVLGPFFVEGAPRIELGQDMAFGATGEPCWVEGSVSGTDGTPLAGARIEVWEADADGMYDVQRDGDRTAARAHLFSDDDGRFAFWGLTPTPYPIPDDGPVGELLAAVGRSPLRAPHLHFLVSHEGYRTLTTHIFVEGDPQLADDSVFGVKASLVKRFERQADDVEVPGGRDLGGRPWSRVRFDVVLAPVAVA